MTVLDKAGSNKQVNISVKTNFCLIEVLVRRRFTERESCLIAPNVIFEELHKRHKILRHWILRDRIPEIPSAVQFFSFVHSGILFELTKESKIMLCITNATWRSYSVLRAPAGVDEYLYYKIWLSRSFTGLCVQTYVTFCKWRAPVRIFRLHTRKETNIAEHVTSVTIQARLWFNSAQHVSSRLAVGVWVACCWTRGTARRELQNPFINT
jgi:hypothetical protein